MNRAARRKQSKEVQKQQKIKFSLLDLQKAISIAIEMKQASGGHLYQRDTERCVFCGVDRKAKKDCKFQFYTFLDRLQTIIINPGFFSDDDIEAVWLQHDEAYKDIRIPISVGKKSA